MESLEGFFSFFQLSPCSPCLRGERAIFARLFNFLVGFRFQPDVGRHAGSQAAQTFI